MPFWNRIRGGACVEWRQRSAPPTPLPLASSNRGGRQGACRAPFHGKTRAAAGGAARDFLGAITLMKTDIKLPAGRAMLDGTLTTPDGATTLVLFVHGSGSSRHSPRNQFVARTLNEAGL